MMKAPCLDETNPWEADDRFAPIFGRIMSAPGVSLGDAYLYGLLASYRGRESSGKCFPSHERIARDLRTDKRYVRRRLKRLEELGLIRIDRSGNRIGKPLM